MRVAVRGVSVWGPGLSGWAQAARVLRGEAPWVAAPVQPPPPASLPANERRRAGAVTRLALALAEDACTQAGLAPAEVRGVFASSNGDGAVLDDILRALTTPGGDVSPTRFHNSVHNTAAGYWTIGHASLAPAVALGCFDWSFGQGLLKAAAECVVEDAPVLLVAYDLPIPGPIGTARVTRDAFGCALMLVPGGTPRAGVMLDLSYQAGPIGPAKAGEQPGSTLIDGNPAASSLPLLAAIARRETGARPPVRIPCLPGHLTIEVT
ncbi:beta-ketoacyl synthase chain length factor [Nguyenibacter vanlangensis]|uniref:Beta-ketoacyl synthase chain length factor n=1 Tax=Nguyenibacter vanlangensis TaxID=1216886 RepID=A0A7Y7ISZ8_9PROT|nr:beta-ketoacyl synthase chain length factor [Nguyenibacter vanlangensis]NVN09753.1 beta-ketoacyl synthase chain length factor [Nguyenibacter vanlangensis]